MNSKNEFVDIIKENEGLIYKITRVYTYNNEDQQDLYQEIVYQLWKSFTSFKNDSKVTTWMYRVALNTSISHLNKEKKKETHTVISEALINMAASNDILQEERIEVLYGLIKKLNTIEKGIVLLYLEGKTYDEISAITGFTATNVGTRLGRIKQKFISQIKSEHYGT